MKKLIPILLLLGVILYCYVHFSTPRVLQRRTDSFLATMNFGALSLAVPEKAADEFASHLADEITFSGSNFEIIAGTPSRAELRSSYLEYRGVIKNSSIERIGKTSVKLSGSAEASVQTTLKIDVVAHGNSHYDQELPLIFSWQKIEGDWLLAEIKLLAPARF